MAVLRFRIYFEEDESIYRDIAIRHKQTFLDLHHTILKSYEFDNKHAATFFRSNDNWQQGREISLDVYDKKYKAAPLLMAETTIGSEIFEPNQKFLYNYDFVKGWSFMIELINISKEENPKLEYPALIRTEGIGPSQYGTKGMLGEKFADVEEKYDLNADADGYEVDGDKDDDGDVADDSSAEDEF